ncbi:MAG: hypothetical protein RLZZ50_1141 [Verrucomicrobiota bacterium]
MASALFTRWFQLQVFTPGFRKHLAADPSAPWCSPDPAQRLLVDVIRLRRRLTPYAESSGADQDLAPHVPRARAASRRSADFTRDAVSLGPQSFGPSLRVIPAPPAATEALPVALPPENGWIDFWTGAAYAGGQTVRVAAPLEQVPIFVRAGTILPLAAGDEGAARAPCPLEIRIYPGTDGSFLLRERIDEKYAGHASIVFEWDERERTLRVGPLGSPKRQALPRRLKIIVVHLGRGIGAECPQRPDLEVDWQGKPLRLGLPPSAPRRNIPALHSPRAVTVFR